MDGRTYIRLDDDMPENPKIDGLSDGAFRLLITTWCWCSRYLTDGVVPKASWEKRGTVRTRKELLGAELAVPRAGGGVLMHDYLVHQRSAAQVKAAIEQRRAAGKAGGKAKGKRVANEPPSESLSESSSEMPSETVSEIEAETETETDPEISTSSVDNLDAVGDHDEPPMSDEEARANREHIAALAAGTLKRADA